MFPTISEYNQAIQQNSRFAFSTLSNLTFIPSRSMPVKIFSFGSGSYAVVFKAVDGHKEYAIRCFISAENENIERYRKITSYLKAINESWVTDIELLENEINVIGKSFPIIKMEWIDGQLINNYVSQNLNNNTRLTELQEEIIKVSQSLERHQIGHGDIQCGNVIVANGLKGKPLIKLIDYDGMYIRSFASQKNLERGRTEFQHPNRSHFEFNERMDRFSFWVILTALEALKYDKTLWNEVMQGGFNTLDNFLFIGDDFKYHYNSKLFKRLDQINSPSLKFYTDKIKFFCENDCSNVIPLELFNEISINRNEKTEQQYFPDLSATHQNTIEIKPTPIFQSQEFDYNAASVNLKLRASIKDNTKGKIEKLESLKTLLDSGAINETEFQKLKNEILFQEETASLITPQVNQFKVNNPPLIKKKTNSQVINNIIVVIILMVVALVIYQLNKDVFSMETKSAEIIKEGPDTDSALSIIQQTAAIVDTAAAVSSSSIGETKTGENSTIKIGNQIWTSTNLDVSYYRNGDAIPEVQDANEWANLTTGAWCFYENKTENGITYGKLYNWYAVNDPRGLAPEGFHIPSDAEWTELTNYLGAESCKKMKSTSGWNNGGNGTNTLGFAGLPGGNRYLDGRFHNVGSVGYWWSSTEYDTTNAWGRFLDYTDSDVGRTFGSKPSGFSVRCLWD